MFLEGSMSISGAFAVLILALISGQVGDQASATSCLSGVKRMLGAGSGYEKLAKVLHESTIYPQLEENVKVASNILREHRYLVGSHDFASLVWNFAMLKGGDDAGSLCASGNLESIRFVAEAMRREGNLSPRRASEPIRRLNRIIIMLVEKAHLVCLKHLEAKWPKPWRPQFSSSDTVFRLSQLINLPNSFIFQSYLDDSPSHDSDDLGHRLLSVIESDPARMGDGPHQAGSQFVVSKGERLRQLEDYIYRPCAEFQALAETKTVLEPYVDLMIASFIIKPNLRSMRKFYQDPSERSQLQWADTDKDVLGMACRYQACEALKDRSREDLAKLMRRARRKSSSPSLNEIGVDSL